MQHIHVASVYSQAMYEEIEAKLARRIAAVKKAVPITQEACLAQLWGLLDSNIFLSCIISELELKHPTASATVEGLLAVQFGFQKLSNEIADLTQMAAISYCALRKFGLDRFEAMNYDAGQNTHQKKAHIFEIFVQPLFDYIVESLDETKSKLSLLLRYKQRAEWFDCERLLKLCKAKKNHEKSLARELYTYLFDQDIQFQIEPQSPRGRIDLIAEQGKKDPLLLDAKVFDGIQRGKHYVCKGFRQVHHYCGQYNEQIGYVIIFNVSDKHLDFRLNSANGAP